MSVTKDVRWIPQAPAVKATFEKMIEVTSSNDMWTMDETAADSCEVCSGSHTCNIKRDHKEKMLLDWKETESFCSHENKNDFLSYRENFENKIVRVISWFLNNFVFR